MKLREQVTAQKEQIKDLQIQLRNEQDKNKELLVNYEQKEREYEQKERELGSSHILNKQLRSKVTTLSKMVTIITNDLNSTQHGLVPSTTSSPPVQQKIEDQPHPITTPSPPLQQKREDQPRPNKRLRTDSSNKPTNNLKWSRRNDSEQSGKSTTLCTYHQRGNCHFGDKCKNSH